ncbi:MAG TPA: hypothetical protein VF520_07215 [Thermoleophilaceae bacterium]|jgi:hypothetical protein
MSEEPLVDRLRTAAAVVDQAELPQDLRPAAFVLAYQSVLPPESAHPTSGAATDETSSTPRSGRGLGEALGGVEDWKLDLIYDISDDNVGLMLPTRALPDSKRAAMAAVTLLVVAARQALQLDEWTEAETVRRVCEDRGVLDRNFATVLDRLNGRGIRVRGRGRTKEIRMNAAGFEEAGRLVERMAESLS